jgi:hypothetical protein
MGVPGTSAPCARRAGPGGTLMGVPGTSAPCARASAPACDSHDGHR